jgi:exodeoxyribonuclease III
VAHEEIDLANPKTNKRNAGFTQEERDNLSLLLKEGFKDTFRDLYPTTTAYSFWRYIGNARAKNIGWRLDYFLVSDGINVKDSEIKDTIMGSDHCPIVLSLEV